MTLRRQRLVLLTADLMLLGIVLFSAVFVTWLLSAGCATPSRAYRPCENRGPEFERPCNDDWSDPNAQLACPCNPMLGGKRK